MSKAPVVIGSSLGAIGSSLVAAVATFCCIGPAAIAVVGISGALAAAKLAPFRPYFILGSVLLLGLGFWLAYRPQRGCIGTTCTKASTKASRILLWLGVIVTVAAVLIPNFISR